MNDQELMLQMMNEQELMSVEDKTIAKKCNTLKNYVEIDKNNQLMRTIVKIKDFIIDKCKDDFIVNKIISYLI